KIQIIDAAGNYIGRDVNLQIVAAFDRLPRGVRHSNWCGNCFHGHNGVLPKLSIFISRRPAGYKRPLPLYNRRALRKSLERLASEPRFATRVKSLNLWAGQSRHIHFNFVTNLRLQVSEVAIAFSKRHQKFLIEVEFGGGIDGIHAILFVNRLAQNQSPTPCALFPEIDKTPGANNVAHYVMNWGALINFHFGLREGAIALHFYRATALKMQDAHALGETLFAHFDEFIGCALSPGGHHAAIVMPKAAKLLPHQGIPPENPVVNHLANRQALDHFVIHWNSRAKYETAAKVYTDSRIWRRRGRSGPPDFVSSRMCHRSSFSTSYATFYSAHVSI